MSKYNISMGNVQNCAIGPGAQVSVSYPISLSFRIDADVYDIASSKALAEGVTLDEIITDKLREWIEESDDGPDTAPAPTLGCPSLTFDLFEYAAFRQSIGLALEPRAEFNAWLAQHSPKALTERLTMVEWIDLWNAFCDEQDARDERDTQADALR